MSLEKPLIVCTIVILRQYIFYLQLCQTAKHMESSLLQRTQRWQGVQSKTNNDLISSGIVADSLAPVLILIFMQRERHETDILKRLQPGHFNYCILNHCQIHYLTIIMHLCDTYNSLKKQFCLKILLLLPPPPPPPPLPTSCSFWAIRLCSDRQNTSLYHRTEAQKKGFASIYPLKTLLKEKTVKDVESQSWKTIT